MKLVPLILLLAATNKMATISLAEILRVKDSAHTILRKQNDTSDGERRRLILAIKNLGQTIASNDKSRIESIFTFPISDEVFSPFITDTAFEHAKSRNNNLLSKKLFDQYFSTISTGLKWGEFRKLFDYLNPTGLQRKDTINFETLKKTQPCYMQYEIIVVEENTILFTYGRNTNGNFQSKTGNSEDEYCGEYSISWEFKFDGQKLIFIRQSAAG
ncbi:MAG: hypothetical protein JST75_04770 [Bacteroidetes bacterium]|nr:hypothetical protein [Bacteroidota bacterium]